MCVISIVETVRLSEAQVRQMYTSNPHGGGVAWRAVVDGVQKVLWKKGLLVDEMVKLNEELPLPYIMHFRVPSSGTSGSWLACHPFQIDGNATTGFEGETEGYVFFHNGFWPQWKDKMQQVALSGFVRIPSGPWSDSRGLAWAAHHLGLGFLDIVDERAVAFGPGEEDLELFGAWMQLKVPTVDVKGITKDEVIIVSNKAWETITYDRNKGNLLDLAKQAITPGAGSAAKIETPGGVSQQAIFCGTKHGATDETGCQGNQQKPVQKADEGVVPSAVEGEGGQHKGHRGTLEQQCVACRKPTPGGPLHNGHRYCWQCWATRDVRVDDAAFGHCAFCKTSRAGSRMVDDDRWMCLACWETNGRPAVYFSHDAAKVRAARAAATHTGVERGGVS